MAAVEAAQVASAEEPPPPPEEEESVEVAAPTEEAVADKSDDANLAHLSLSDMLQEALGAGTSSESPDQEEERAETDDEGTTDIGDKMRNRLIEKLRDRAEQHVAQGA